MGALFKPNDMVETALGRPARISEVLPAHRRKVVYLDEEGGVAELPISALKIVMEAPVKRWTSHTL